MEIGKLDKRVNVYRNSYQLNEIGEKVKVYTLVDDTARAANIDFTGGAENEKEGVRQPGTTITITIRYDSSLKRFVDKDMVIYYDTRYYDVMSYQIINRNRFYQFKCILGKSV